MIQLTLKQLASITKGQIRDDEKLKIKGISIDSRTLQAGNVFFAIKGENLDGHEYVAAAKSQGAIAAIVSRKVNCELPQIIVEDTSLALGQVGKYWREKFDIPFIALTGSNGKTTTKNMIQAILTEMHDGKTEAVLATKGNLNNHIGLPLMLAQLTPKHRIAVIEMGMNHFHEISYLTKLVNPNTALITNAGPCHLEGVGGVVSGVAKAKGEIFEGLVANGHAVINADDEFAEYWKGLVTGKTIVTFGIRKPSDVRGEISNSGFLLHYRGETINIHLNLLGQHNVMNALAASAATLIHGAKLQHIKKALEKLMPAPGRMETKQGRGGVTLIDDTYNANPLSLGAAMRSIKDFPGIKILVLGDMRELGPQAELLHRESGRLAKELGINHLLATGELTQHTVKSFGEHARHFQDHASLIQALEQYLQQNTMILVKGSRSMKMEQVVKALLI